MIGRRQMMRWGRGEMLNWHQQIPYNTEAQDIQAGNHFAPQHWGLTIPVSVCVGSQGLFMYLVIREYIMSSYWEFLSHLYWSRLASYWDTASWAIWMTFKDTRYISYMEMWSILWPFHLLTIGVLKLLLTLQLLIYLYRSRWGDTALSHILCKFGIQYWFCMNLYMYIIEVFIWYHLFFCTFSEHSN